MQKVDHLGQRFVERMGQQFEVDGLPRIAGRILGHLLLVPDALSLDEIAAALQVSKGSVSQDTRILERIGVVERVRRAGDRRLYYRIVESVHEQMLKLRLERFEKTLSILRDGMRSEAASNEVVHERLGSFCEFFEHLTEAIEETRDRWLRAAGAGERTSDEAGSGQ